MREKVRFLLRLLLFFSTEMAVFSNRQNLIKREKNVIFITNLGIFHIIAISSLSYLSILLSFLFFYL